MRIFLVYGTVEGQTKKITEHIQAHLQAAGHDTRLCDASAKPGEAFDLDDADAVIVAACVHQKLHQEAVVDFVLAHQDQLNTKPGAFVSVSLAPAIPDGGREEAQGYIDTFLADTGWTPLATLTAAGALRYDAYDFFKQQIVKFVIAQKGIEVTPGDDHEFTDWMAVDRFVDDFAKMAASGAMA